MIKRFETEMEQRWITMGRRPETLVLIFHT